MYNIFYKDLKIKCIFKKTLKNTYLSVDKASNITIKTPNHSERYIYNLIAQKEVWIRKQLAKNMKNPPIHITLDGIDSKKTKEYLTQRVDYFSEKMGLPYRELKFRKMKSRWGSCSSNGIITLNKKLIKTPQICIDYVVIHELAHLKHLNHSKKFHELVEKYCQTVQEAKEILARIIH